MVVGTVRADFVQVLDCLLGIIFLVDHVLAQVDRARRPPLRARTVVGHEQDSRVLLQTQYLQFVQQAPNMGIGVFQECRIGLL